MVRYKDVGVDIDKADVFKRKAKQLIRQTFSKSVLTDIGLFGGLYSIPGGKILVSSIDGVGTKTIVAGLMGQHEVIGYDVVSHGANDILAQGARPLFFLDYIGTGKLDNAVCLQLIKGMAKACREVGCSLIGGETAQMPDVYMKGEYDLVGCIIGIVEKNKVIDGSKINHGDIVIGLQSTGLHTNGYTLARKVLLARYKAAEYVPALKTSVGDVLLKPHKSYCREILGLAKKIKIKGIAHITGGGLVDNIPRILPADTGVILYQVCWNVPPVFTLIQELGNVPRDDMYRTFNMGIGMVLIVGAGDRDKALEYLKNAHVIGEVVKGKGVRING